MRKWNAMLTVLILALFLLHGILGSFQLLGWGNTALKSVAWITVALVAVHAAMGVKLTTDTLKVWRKTGVGYFRENKLFWARRISGFAVMVLLALHLTAFRTGGETPRLPYFGAAQLAAQLLLAAAIAVHVISNVRPVLIALGLGRLRRYAADILIVLSALLLFMGLGFVVYYLRWNVF